MATFLDLLEDLEFIRWVKYPDPDLETYWKSWMEANPKRIEDVKLAREVIHGLKFPSKNVSKASKEEVLLKILSETNPDYQERESLDSDKRTRIFRVSWQITRVAAILVICFILSFLYYYSKRENTVTTRPTTNWITKSTNEGEKLNFRLPDQTVVWLNSGSSLKYPEKFDSTVRFVELIGEGFFEVAENPDQPFQVKASNLTTTALGTSFNINATVSEGSRISLVTGKVSVLEASSLKTYFLKPGQALSYESSADSVSIADFDQELDLGWRFGKLIFLQANFAQVIQQLELWYGVEFNVKGTPPHQWKFNGKFENQTLNNVLTSISNIENFTYQLENKKVTIHFNN
ncbi:ferric-dicitrate binding protein FerR (iron transport regulator) [Algoriphagus iocasae]|uniref:Ferric-dicitrate binding protein FerR (Iron transport regulator) n=1 Tax=Algoriphagus iocasae TaxID=1836499 RepID=A0A841MZB8_9BACT|nr:FecR family protein [Algoriphagus iocasae]MBB6327805.1 ferric-dicitrate binding protein FerR (iron transport regulator) [Algoriphagus iocasae]